MRDTADAADDESGAPSGEAHSTAGELLWADQLHLHKRYGDEVHIALVDQPRLLEHAHHELVLGDAATVLVEPGAHTWMKPRASNSLSS